MGGLAGTWISGAAIWLLILPYAGIGAGVHFWVVSGTTSLLIGIVGFWILFDILLAPGFFCRSLCPTGFLLEQIGRYSWLRISKRGDAKSCPEGCRVCQTTCPYSLRPPEGEHFDACDGCGRCVMTCPGERLERRFVIPLSILMLIAFVWLPAPASAHHNKGMPHYGYFENYAQVPNEEFLSITDRWEMGATLFNFQGLDRRTAETPNDVKIYIYLYDLVAGRGWTGRADFSILDDDQTIAVFTREHVDEESVYSTRETIPHSGDFEIIAEVDGDRVVLPFHVELADGGIRWGLIVGLTIPVAMVFGLALHGRSRRRRGNRRIGQVVAVGLLGLAFAGSSEMAAAAPHHHREHSPTEVASSHDPIQHLQHPISLDSHGNIVMVMGGIPLPYVLVGVAGILILSFAATERWAPIRTIDRVSRRRSNLIRSRRVYQILRSRWVQPVAQLSMLVVLLLLVVTGLVGGPSAALVPAIVWTLWWGGLILAVLVLGSAWCFICPWDGLANLVTRMSAIVRVEPISMGLRFPRFLANVYPAIVIFGALTWFELTQSVTTDSRWTAYMGIGMAMAAVGSALVWDDKRFCAHACPVGRICGIYSNVSPIEIRARNPRTCEVCETEECVHGNDRGYPCPTGISLKTVDSATMCTACTECIKSCDKHNVAINIRPLGSDLKNQAAPRLDVAWLAVALLALTLFHGLSMTGMWENFEPGRPSILKSIAGTFGTTRLTSFTLGMSAFVAIPPALFGASCFAAAAWTGNVVSGTELFKRQALSLLPIALFYHLAHNVMHLAREGGNIVSKLSDPFGVGENLFGLREVAVSWVAPESALWVVQLGLIVFGHVLGVVVAHRIGHAVFSNRGLALRSLVPLLAVMVLVSVAGLWLTHLDMNMRLGRM